MKPEKPKRLPNNPFEDSTWNFMLYLFNRPRWDIKVQARKKKYDEDYRKYLRYDQEKLLEKYRICPECNDESTILTEGCVMCLNCAFSAG